MLCVMCDEWLWTSNPSPSSSTSSLSESPPLAHETWVLQNMHCFGSSLKVRTRLKMFTTSVIRWIWFAVKNLVGGEICCIGLWWDDGLWRVQTEIGNHTGTGLKLWLWFEIPDIAVSGQRKSLTQTRMENETELIPLIKISDENMTPWSGLLEFSGSESTQGFFLQISAEMWGDDAAWGRLASLGGSREVRTGKRGGCDLKWERSTDKIGGHDIL